MTNLCVLQVVIALTGGELVYFEMDPSGQLNEYTESKEMSKDVVCMGLGRVPAGEQRCRFLAVCLADNTVRILSLDPSVCMSLSLFSARMLFSAVRPLCHILSLLHHIVGLSLAAEHAGLASCP